MAAPIIPALVTALRKAAVYLVPYVVDYVAKKVANALKRKKRGCDEKANPDSSVSAGNTSASPSSGAAVDKKS